MTLNRIFGEAITPFGTTLAPLIQPAACSSLKCSQGFRESTMLLLRVKVTAGGDQTGKVSIDYGVYASDITFVGDERKDAKLEFVAVAWDKDNRAAGNVSATMDLDLKQETFQKMMNTGVPAHQELTLKPGSYKLRLGVMDYASSKIGTLEVPVTVGDQQTASN